MTWILVAIQMTAGVINVTPLTVFDNHVECQTRALMMFDPYNRTVRYECQEFDTRTLRKWGNDTATKDERRLLE